MWMGAITFASQRSRRCHHQPSTTTTSTARLSKFAGGRATACCLVALWSSTARGAAIANTMAYVSRSRVTSSRSSVAFAARLSWLKKSTWASGGGGGKGIDGSLRRPPSSSAAGNVGVGLRGTTGGERDRGGLPRRRQQQQQQQHHRYHHQHKHAAGFSGWAGERSSLSSWRYTPGGSRVAVVAGYGDGGALADGRGSGVKVYGASGHGGRWLSIRSASSSSSSSSSAAAASGSTAGNSNGFDEEQLAGMSYRELQTLAKENQLPANKPAQEIIRSLAAIATPQGMSSDDGSGGGEGGYQYGGSDPDNEEVPDMVTGEGWVSGVLDDDIMGGIDFDEEGFLEDEDENQEGQVDVVGKTDMDGLIGGVDRGEGWVSFKLKGGVPVQTDELDADPDDLSQDLEDDMDARIRDAMSPVPRLAVKRIEDSKLEDYGFARDNLNLEKLMISVPAGCCPGCGTKFQSDDEESPGFLRRELVLEMEANALGIPVEDMLAFEEEKTNKKREEDERRPADADTATAADGVSVDPKYLDPEAWLDAQPDINNSLEFDVEDESHRSVRGIGEGRATRRPKVGSDGVALGRASRDLVGTTRKGDAEMTKNVAARTEQVDEVDGMDEDEELEEKLVVCQRCHKLRFYGSVTESLRPGFSDSDLLTPQRFLELLGTLRRRKCLVIYLVDLFDFDGSFLYNLPKVVGDNRVLVAGNKADLLPKDLSTERVTKWVRDKCRESGLPGMEMRDVHLVSCKMGFGLAPLMRKAREEALFKRCDIYVIGAANVGKSTFINHIIQDKGDNGGGVGNKRKGGRGGRKGSGGRGGGDRDGRSRPGRGVTVSSIPGTTLGFLKVDLGDKRSLFDTPGLLLKHTLTSRLTAEELRAVIPKKRVEHVTLRLGEGNSVLMGGFARIEVLQGRPFMLTFFVSNDVRLHPTGISRVQHMLSQHVGKNQLIFPPYSPERVDELGEQVATDFDIVGAGWRESAADVVIAGLGWISVTGAGPVSVRVWAPKGVLVMARDPLLPYESWETTSKFTGAAMVKKGRKKQGRRV